MAKDHGPALDADLRGTLTQLLDGPLVVELAVLDARSDMSKDELIDALRNH